MNRRHFVSTLIAALAAPPVIRTAPGSRRVLVLGGTGFFGPVLVQALIDRGHQVTLFNRGLTHPDRFPDLPRIRGDRMTEDRSGLSALREDDRHWDWVVDTWQGAPRCVLDTANLLRARAGHYQYVSSIAVYRDWDRAGIGEDHPLNEMPPLPDSLTPSLRYGLRKVLGESAARSVFGSQAACFRSHGMHGLPIVTPIEEHYWPVRLSRGGEILAPADAEHCQMTDMISLARFMAHCGEQRIGGPFNVAYPATPFRSYIGAIEDTLASRADLVWISAEFLARHDILPYRDLPLWRPEPIGFYRFSIERALKHGLVNRPMTRMIADQLAGYRSRHPDDNFAFGQPDSGTISSETEQRLIRLWKATTDAAA